MSRNTDTPTLLTQLIHSHSPNPTSTFRTQSFYQRAVRTIQIASTNSINPFAVHQRLTGLEERWRISSEDEVADALSTRIEQLQVLEDNTGYRRIPECLQLILSLSSGGPNFDFEDNLVEARERAQKPTNTDRDPGADYKDESAIWDSVDYGGSDSEDETVYVASSPIADREDIETNETSDDEDDLQNLYVSATKENTSSQNSDSGQAPPKTATQKTTQALSEATIMREAILMLHGLPTSIFEISPANKVSVVEAATLADTSSKASQDVLTQFASLGSITVPIKAWSSSDEQSATMCRFQSVVAAILAEFLGELQCAERAILDSDMHSPTCIHLLNHMKEKIEPIALLNSCLPHVVGHNREVRLLDNLVYRITEQEAIGASTEPLIAAFTSCFETYWRPVEAWLQGGNVTCDGITFIHAANESDLPLDGLWRGLFDFTYNKDASFEAPEFMQFFIATFMTIGKTAYMLNKLEQQTVIRQFPIAGDWMTSVLLHERHLFEPFENCLERAVQYRASMSQGLSRGLLEHLHNDWSFHNTVTATELVYLARIGSVNDKAHTALFQLLDRSRHQEWGDQHILTGIFQDAFTNIETVNASKLTASFVPTDRSTNSRSRSLVQLEAIKLNLVMSWPLANIVDAGAISILQRVAIVLMQTARAKYVLDQYSTRFDPDCIINKATRRTIMAFQQRLRWFVDTLHSYLAFDVLSSTSVSLSMSSSEATDLDAVIVEFRSAMESLERGCLLSEHLSSSHQAMVSILDLAVILSDLCLRDRLCGPSGKPGAFSDGENSDGGSCDKGISRLSTSDFDPDGAKVRELFATFHSLLVFVQAGVREASRLDGDTKLELFADDLAMELECLKWTI